MQKEKMLDKKDGENEKDFIELIFAHRPEKDG